MPVRIQRSRAVGWRLPEGAVYVGRPTKWGNPFLVSTDTLDTFGNPSPLSVIDSTDRRPVQHHFLTRRHALDYAVNMYRTSLRVAKQLPEEAALAEPWALAIVQALPEIAGRDLACWCPLNHPCHADVLLDMANGGPDVQKV